METKERIIALKLIKKKNNNETFFDEIGVTISMEANCKQEKMAEKVVALKEEK